MIKNCYNCEYLIDLKKIFICDKWRVEIQPNPYLFCEKWKHDHLHDDNAEELGE